MAIGDIKTFDIVYTGLTLQINAIDMGNGTVRFEIVCVSGSADINALYWSDGDATAGEGTLSGFDAKKDSSLNMNGSGEAWDGGVKLSSAGIGAAGVNKPTYLQTGESYVTDATLNWSTLDTLGVRATSTSTAGGSIKGVDGDAEVTLAPKVCVEDAAPVVEGNDASFTIKLDHAYDYDVTVTYTTVTGTAGSADYTETTDSVTIAAGDLSTVVTIATTDDAEVEGDETFTLHLTGATANIPGNDISVALQCFNGTGTILDNDTDGGPDDGPPPAATAFSHGYWMNHDFSGSEGFADGVDGQTFDDFFNLDNGGARTWTDADGTMTDPPKPELILYEFDDLSFSQAVGFGNGAGSAGDTTAPVVTGDYSDLVREATTAVLNFYDDDVSASFIDWYIYERANYIAADLQAADDLSAMTDDQILADLQQQVQDTFDGAADAYTVGELAELLHLTHH